METTINLQDQIVVDNATQRTISIIGGKGTGKTTLIMMLLKEIRNNVQKQCSVLHSTGSH